MAGAFRFMLGFYPKTDAIEAKRQNLIAEFNKVKEIEASNELAHFKFLHYLVQSPEFLEKKKTLQNLLCKSPHLFPSPIKIPGARGPRWSAPAIENWINELEREAISARASQLNNTPRPGRGRPRIVRIGGAK